MTTERANTFDTGLSPSVTEETQSDVFARHRGAILDTASDWEAFELRRRALAGVWAARVALVLSIPFAMTAWATGTQHARVTYIVLPVIAAFFAGAFFGSAICNPHMVPDESLAGRRGSLVALAAYIIFAAEVAALSDNPFGAGFDAFMAALIISGWVVFPVAFFAGIMAFRAREGKRRYQDPSQA